MTPSALTALAGQFLARQRWFAGSAELAAGAELVEAQVLREAPVPLTWMLVDAGGATYQMLVGSRPEAEALAALQGQDNAVLGLLPDGHLAYDALADTELALAVLELVSEGAQSAERVRPVGGEQSNTSLIYDDRLILKLLRRVQPGVNPDVELSLALDSVGFNHVAAPVGNWRRGDYDLAIVRELLVGGSEGWALALTSLRDLYGRAGAGGSATGPGDRAEPPGPEVAAAAGGDFGAEARRLGEMTAKLHLALAEALGAEPGDPGAWADDVGAQMSAAGLDSAGSAVQSAALRAVSRPGCAIRLHGDYHLGQVMRTDQGWFVLDFEGEPARPLADRRRRRSPLKDVAGMLRSFGYAAAAALGERHEEAAGSLLDIGAAWEERNRACFLQGYLSTPGIGELLPDMGSDFDTVLRALEVEKAAYELAYEQAYRPAWVDIPTRALNRLLRSEEEV